MFVAWSRTTHTCSRTSSCLAVYTHIVGLWSHGTPTFSLLGLEYHFCEADEVALTQLNCRWDQAGMS